MRRHGVIDLDDAVAKYRPEFADLKVLDGWDGDEPRLRDRRRPPRCVSSPRTPQGSGYWFWNADLVRWEAKTGTANTLAGTADAFTAPLVADPGTKVEYGTNTDWLGLVVEAASGQKLDAYFDEHILGPLGMEQTTFHPTDSSARTCPRCTCAARRPGGGRPPAWTGTPRPTGGPAATACTARRASTCGSSGCCSTTARSTARRSSRPRRSRTRSPTRSAASTGPRRSPPPSHRTTADFNAGPGYKFGLGLLRNTEDIEGMRRAGSGAWAGIFNTHFWVDRTAGVSGAIYTQTLPFVEPAVFQVYIDFEQALYASL